MRFMPIENISFYYLCSIYNLNDENLATIAIMAKVSREVVDSMYDGSPVRHGDAMKALAAFSEQVGVAWTLGETSIPVILPTFSDLCTLHQVNIEALALYACMSINVLKAMISGEPVGRSDAIRALSALSIQCGQGYTLDNVAVKLIEEK